MSLKVIFRTVPRKWTILANQITMCIQLDHPAVIALLVQSNENLFTGCLLSSKVLQTFGIYNGKYFDHRSLNNLKNDFYNFNIFDILNKKLKIL